MKHNEQMLKVLSDAATQPLPEQMGSQYTLQELAICGEMVNAGLLDGDLVEDETGRICTILYPKITLKGREFLQQHSENTFVKKHGVRFRVWLLGAVGALVIAWLIKTLGLN